MENKGSRSKPLPDIVSEHMKILFVGCNPGLRSAEVRHHYAGKSNRFWRLLYDSGLTPYLLKPEEDNNLLGFGYGSTNLVSRASKNANELSVSEFKEGSRQLLELITKLKPRFICYVGFEVYRIFKANLQGVPKNRIQIVPGIQDSFIIQGTTDYVCSSSSGLNTIPYERQLQCFVDLKKLVT